MCNRTDTSRREERSDEIYLRLGETGLRNDENYENLVKMTHKSRRNIRIG